MHVFAYAKVMTSKVFIPPMPTLGALNKHYGKECSMKIKWFPRNTKCACKSCLHNPIFTP